VVNEHDILLRGPILAPRLDGRVEFIRDGALAYNATGTLTYVGPFVPSLATHDLRLATLLLPPLIDIHTHIPQHPIRGRFVEGVPDDAPKGKLLAGLHRNVFPAEGRCADVAHAEMVVREFLRDTLAHGVVGGAAYMTTSPLATDAALRLLPDMWHVGLVLMNQNTPEYLLTDERTVEADHERLASRYGKRLIVTDRFAVAVSTPLRQRASATARKLGLRTQTHLNEQVGEKSFVERTLYPSSPSYAGVYHTDGLLDHRCILAHCIQMTPDEWSALRDTGSTVAHCPTSNQHLGSGVMPLDEVKRRGIDYAIATDVGASPTVSMLAEMARFVQVHAGRSTQATPGEALYRATLAPARNLGLAVGLLEAGRPASFVEADVDVSDATSADDAIRELFPRDLDAPTNPIRRVVIDGREMVAKDEGGEGARSPIRS
jgi:guanine deaminase